ncbi:DUF4359 domain-containing protein [Lyngbya aestuarii]|uniref:DUF4359 domain-containing protein n=1 Tax=Lyngbya aestuarii TaxID=118322 RepID=UPI00403E07BA
MKALQVVTAMVCGVALVGLGASLALTNPGRDAYQNYAVEQLSKYLKDEVCTKAPEIKSLQNLIQGNCTTIIDTGRPLIGQIISKNTTRDNFLLFSIYQTDLDIGASLPAYEFKTIGVFQQFYIYEAQKQ